MTMAKTDNGAISEDTLLDGRVRLLQPLKGYRVAIDTVLMAASIPAKPADLVLDVGAGVGAAALCLAARLPSVRVKGIESNGYFAELAVRNAAANGVNDRVEFVKGDILDDNVLLPPASFDHVMANPPYYKAGSTNPPADQRKVAATIEGEAKLADWVKFCGKMVRSKGSVSIIYHNQRLPELLRHMCSIFDEIIIYPLLPDSSSKPAKRIIVRGRKGMKVTLRTATGLVLHDKSGKYTSEAAKVLRDGAPLKL